MLPCKQQHLLHVSSPRDPASPSFVGVQDEQYKEALLMFKSYPQQTRLIFTHKITEGSHLGTLLCCNNMNLLIIASYR